MKFLSVNNKAKKSGTRTSKRTQTSRLRILRSVKSQTRQHSTVASALSSVKKSKVIAPQCIDGSLDMRFNVNKGQTKYNNSCGQSDQCPSVASLSTVSASQISLKTDNKKLCEFFKMYEESELSYFDSEIGARLQHSLIFQGQDDDCASDDEGIDYGKNRTLKSLKQSI